LGGARAGYPQYSAAAEQTPKLRKATSKRRLYGVLASIPGAMALTVCGIAGKMLDNKISYPKNYL